MRLHTSPNISETITMNVNVCFTLASRLSKHQWNYNYECQCVFQSGFTALHLGAQNGHNESSRVLLYGGINPDLQNNVSHVLHFSQPWHGTTHTLPPVILILKLIFINGMMRKRLWQVLRDGLHFLLGDCFRESSETLHEEKVTVTHFQGDRSRWKQKRRKPLTVVLVLNVKQQMKRKCCRMTLHKFAWFIIWLYKELLMTLRNFAWFIVWLPIYYMLCVGIWTEEHLLHRFGSVVLLNVLGRRLTY